MLSCPRPGLGWHRAPMAFPVQPASRSRELEQSRAEQGSQLCLGARVGSWGLAWAAGNASWLLLPHAKVLRANRERWGLGHPDTDGPLARTPCCSRLQQPPAAGSAWTGGVSVCRLQGRQGILWMPWKLPAWILSTIGQPGSWTKCSHFLLTGHY